MNKRMLENLQPIGPDAVPQLIQLLRDENLRHLAVMILADLGPAAKPAVKKRILANELNYGQCPKS